MSEQLRAWLTQELDRLNWSHRELARQTGLSASIVSKTLSGERNPSAEFCIKVAQALNESPEKLLRLAAILPSLPPTDDATIQEILDSLHNMPPAKREEVLRYVRYLFQQD